MKLIKSDTIFENLKNRIYSGEFNSASRLPSEKELSDFYGCSRPTLRKALESLEQAGLITRKQGSGSFLTEDTDDTVPLRSGLEMKTSLFGIIFPNLGDNYVFNIICSELSKILAKMNCSLVWGGTISPGSDNLMNEVEQICKKYVELKVDGVFCAPLEYTPYRDQANTFIVDAFHKAGIPLVLIDSDLVEFPERTAHDLVSLDHIQASYLLTKHMLDQHARTLHFLSPPMSARTIKLRQMGFREAMFDAHLPVTYDQVHVGEPSDVQFVSSILESQAEGILCSNDGTAITLLATLDRLGLSVPKDIIVAGFDNLSYLSQIRTPLTSIAQPTEMISLEAVRLMFDRMENLSRPYKTVRFPGLLIARRSTRFGFDQV